MKVLQINKFFRQVGGSERYMFEVSQLLQNEGHEVIFFAMRHPENEHSPQESFFVSTIEYGDTTPVYKLKTLWRTVGKTVYSFESRRKMRALVEAERPDMAHIHVISHQISPSILDALRDAGVPTVQSMHDYKQVCPSYQLYIHHKGEICERCLSGNYYNAVLQRCIKKSIPGSILAAGAQYLHRASHIYEKNIDFFIAPSRFMRDKLVEGGVPREKIRVLAYGIDIGAYAPNYDAGDYAVYFGRLSPEKGLTTLLHAMERIPDLKLVVVGEGPHRAELERAAERRGLVNISFVGHKDGDALKDLVRNAAFSVLPPEWYENSPLSIYESHALGTPVVASRIGGIPELIEDDESGLLFTPGDAEELAERMATLFANKDKCREMGRRGREEVERLCAKHYGGLMAVYEEARTRH